MYTLYKCIYLYILPIGDWLTDLQGKAAGELSLALGTRTICGIIACDGYRTMFLG